MPAGTFHGPPRKRQGVGSGRRKKSESGLYQPPPCWEVPAGTGSFIAPHPRPAGRTWEVSLDRAGCVGGGNGSRKEGWSWQDEGEARGQAGPGCGKRQHLGARMEDG